MATEVRVWQITGKAALEEVESTLAGEGRTEPKDLEQWILSNPAVLGDGIQIIGRQVHTKTGPLDLLAIDASGNTIVVELKRDLVPREAMAQALDYASDVAAWDLDRLDNVCMAFRKQSLDEVLTEMGAGGQDVTFNQSQRIMLVGTILDASLERMVEWLSHRYKVPVNALVLKYIKTKSGDELLARTMIVPEAEERERIRATQGRIEFSDTPGDMPEDELRARLRAYLEEDRAVPRRIRKVLLPLCLRKDVVTREDITKELVRQSEATDDTQAGFVLTTISRELGFAARSYLRQVIRYDKPEWGGGWTKDNYRIAPEHKAMVVEVLKELHSPI